MWVNPLVGYFLAIKLLFEMGTFANSVDPDEMLHNAAFHQGLHCLLRQYQSSEKENLDVVFSKL